MWIYYLVVDVFWPCGYVGVRVHIDSHVWIYMCVEARSYPQVWSSWVTALVLFFFFNTEVFVGLELSKYTRPVGWVGGVGDSGTSGQTSLSPVRTSPDLIIKRWVDNENVVPLHHGNFIQLLKKNEISNFLGKQMELESTILSEVIHT